ESLGAGGWIDSDTAKALPVELDPPSIRQMPRGALALIMHSCEMPQGNFWGQKVAEAAIEALSRLDYIGIVEYNWGAVNAIQGVGWAFPMQLVGDKTAALAATKTMTVGDMPDFEASMKQSLTGLQSVNAGQKHVVIISDGDPSPPSPALLNQYVASKVTVTTIMVGGHGTMMDQNKMKAVATKTGGRFYNITNPKQLPQIFIKEAQMVSRSLIQEGDTYQPQIVSRMPGPIEGVSAVPAIDGYVLCAPRKGLAQTPLVIPTSEGNDPIYANWNYGLGKSIAYTSDLTGRWGSRWVGWSDFQGFWEQSIRWVMRPSSPSNLALTTRLDGDEAVVELEALDADASFLNFLQTAARVIAPSGETTPLPLQQVGPGRYRAAFATNEPGAYLVNVHYEGGVDGASAKGHLQAAVSVPYSREFRAIKHNAALLTELAERTGGRVLTATNPEILDLFERESLEVPRSRKRIWDLLAIIAAALFIVDVASRRLAVDIKWLRGLVGQAAAKRGDKTDGTVTAWKRTKAEVERSRGAQVERAKQAKARFEADDADAATAIDVGAGVAETGDPLKAAAKAKRPAAEPEKAEEEDSMSRLLRAKRRAIDEDDASKEPRKDG
ncbi:MAG: vWA domain-containing protein, partial [Planctomycetota bacterium]